MTWMLPGPMFTLPCPAPACCPHPRGWSQATGDEDHAGDLLPALAGMVPCRFSRVGCSRCRPQSGQCRGLCQGTCVEHHGRGPGSDAADRQSGTGPGPRRCPDSLTQTGSDLFSVIVNVAVNAWMGGHIHGEDGCSRPVSASPRTDTAAVDAVRVHAGPVQPPHAGGGTGDAWPARQPRRREHPVEPFGATPDGPSASSVRWRRTWTTDPVLPASTRRVRSRLRRVHRGPGRAGGASDSPETVSSRSGKTAARR
jgi:hypothetical protein